MIFYQSYFSTDSTPSDLDLTNDELSFSSQRSSEYEDDGGIYSNAPQDDGGIYSNAPLQLNMVERQISLTRRSSLDSKASDGSSISVVSNDEG